MITLNSLLQLLATVPSMHKPDTKQYNYLKQLSKDLALHLFGKDSACIDNWDYVGKMYLPFFEMGSINSIHLFGIDELIIFSYYIFNSSSYGNALDIGANIGLHSLVLSKLGIKTKSFEPDPFHMKQLDLNLINNNAQNNITKIDGAVSDSNKKLSFCRVKGNTTGSHLVGSKENPYGELEYFEVNCVNINDYFYSADLIKLDAEGHEDVILCSLDFSEWKNQDIFVEVGSKKNAEKIFNYFLNSGINLFSQKSAWSRVSCLNEMPFSYKDGSLFISKKNKMNWNN